jgi:hypothetical protein
VRTNAAPGALHVAQLLRALCGEGEGVPTQASLGRPLSGSGVENEHPSFNYLVLLWKPVLGIRIRMFLDLPDPDPLVKGMDPNSSLFSEMC